METTTALYGVSTKLVSLIKSNYEGITCKVIQDGKFSKQFQFQTGVR